jgi:hypothetical protein
MRAIAATRRAGNRRFIAVWYMALTISGRGDFAEIIAAGRRNCTKKVTAAGGDIVRAKKHML